MIRGLKAWLWAAAALVAAAIIAYILIVSSHRTASGENVPPLQRSVYDDRLDELDRRAIESAYMHHVGLLFDNWVKEIAHDQPARALKGLGNARSVYIDSMTAIDARKRGRP